MDAGLPLPEEEGVHVAVVLDEGVLHFVVESLLWLELLSVEKVDDVFGGQEDIDEADAETQDRQPARPLLSQLQVEEYLASAPQNQGYLYEFHAVDGETGIDVGIDAGAAEEDHFVYPVEEAETDEHEDCSTGYEGGVEVGEPY